MQATDMQTTDSRRLRELADNLKADAKALRMHNRTEAMRLFRLFREVTNELYRRHNSSTVHFWN